MYTLRLILLILSWESLAIADPPGEGWEQSAYLMAGEYTVIGRKPDSKTLYSGHLSIHANGKKLDFVKTIDRLTVRGTAYVGTLPDIKGSRLHLTFVQNGQVFEGQYEFSVDCNKAFRFTGYIGSNKHTKVAGLEAFFPDHSPIGR